MQQIRTRMGFAFFLSTAFVLTVSPLVGLSQAAKATFSTQMFCDDGYGPQYAGCASLSKKGDFTAKLTGLPPSTPMSCALECELSGFPIDLPECGMTDKDGNLDVDYKSIAGDFGGSCIGLRITAYSLGELSCAQGFAAGACQKHIKQNQNGTYTALCKNVNCANPCTVSLIEKSTGKETDTGKAEWTYDPKTHVATCPCK